MKSINTAVISNSKKVDVNTFWNTDISVIENHFLKGRDISTLPIHLDDRVPPQGSVLLNRTIQPKLNFFHMLCDIFK